MTAPTRPLPELPRLPRQPDPAPIRPSGPGYGDQTGLADLLADTVELRQAARDDLAALLAAQAEVRRVCGTPELAVAA